MDADRSINPGSTTQAAIRRLLIDPAINGDLREPTTLRSGLAYHIPEQAGYEKSLTLKKSDTVVMIIKPANGGLMVSLNTAVPVSKVDLILHTVLDDLSDHKLVLERQAAWEAERDSRVIKDLLETLDSHEESGVTLM